MDKKVELFYRRTFADLKVDHEERDELREFFIEMNPPPDKIVWIRAAAFRVGSEFIQVDNHSVNVALLRCINSIVHALERSILVPNQSMVMTGEEDEARDYSELQSELEKLYRDLYSDLKVDHEESVALKDFFQNTKLPMDKLTWARGAAFRIASEFLSEDDKSSNISLLRCVNFIVHTFEMAYLVPKKFNLRIDSVTDPKSMSVDSLGLRASINRAIQVLWDLDENRLVPNDDYKINVQRGKKPYHRGDGASLPLFSFVDREALRRPTYKAFIELLDNYDPNVGNPEVLTNEERREITRFLDAIMETAPMQFCQKYLLENCPKDDEIPSDEQEFKRLLHKIWFQLYGRSRGTRSDSSGFEHVFVGETNDEGEVTGFHNWIQFYLEEKRGVLDYYGYIKPRCNSSDMNVADTDGDDRLLTVQFEWKGVMKSVGSMLIGVSPEFEMALYTLCFLMGEHDNICDLDVGQEIFTVNIKCFSIARGKIGTSFPLVLSHHDDDN